MFPVFLFSSWIFYLILFNPSISFSFLQGLWWTQHVFFASLHSPVTKNRRLSVSLWDRSESLRFAKEGGKTDEDKVRLPETNGAFALENQWLEDEISS